MSELAALVSAQEYACASAVYRWDVFAYHSGSEFEMLEDDFLLAVKAAWAYLGSNLVESAHPKGI